MTQAATREFHLISKCEPGNINDLEIEVSADATHWIVEENFGSCNQRGVEEPVEGRFYSIKPRSLWSAELDLYERLVLQLTRCAGTEPWTELRNTEQRDFRRPYGLASPQAPEAQDSRAPA